MVKIRSCFALRNLNDFDVVRNTLAPLSQLYSFVQNEVEKAKKFKSKVSKLLTWIREPVIDYKDPDLK
jgi:hypothetical protein